MKKIFLTSLTALLLFTLNTNAQETTSIGTPLEGVLDGKKLSYNVFAEFSMLEVELLNLEEGSLISENISSYVMGLNSTLHLSQRIDFVGAVGLSKGFDYRFASTNLAFKLSPSFNLNLGCGLYMIDDEKWNPQGLDGEDPSNKDFGLNFGLACQLTDHLGISVRYNIIEEKEDYENGSMSINGLSFGIILK